MFLLLQLPGGGDELQGIKRGIMELADLILINKADDDLQQLAGRSAADYRSALRLLHPRTNDWKVQVQTCSARDGVGISDAWDVVLKHRQVIEASGQLKQVRAEQARGWMWSEVSESLIAALRNDVEVHKHVAALEAATSDGRIPPSVAAAQLLDIFLGQHKK